MTYDREVIKIPEAQLQAAHKALSEPPAEIKPVVPDARTQAVVKAATGRLIEP